MNLSIEIDRDVWNLLKREAEPLVDTPNTVLRRLLGIGDQPKVDIAAEVPVGAKSTRGATGKPRVKSSPKGKRQRRRGPRAPIGSLLPESEYEHPILRVLGERGGSAPAREVIPLVGALVDDRLTRLDREDLPNGLKRWESRVQFTRLRMRKAGVIRAESPRGIWELSEAGLAAYHKLGETA